MIMVCGPPFIEYDGVRFNEKARGPVDKAVGTVVLGKSKEDAGE